MLSSRTPVPTKHTVYEGEVRSHQSHTRMCDFLLARCQSTFHCANGNNFVFRIRMQSEKCLKLPER